MSVIYLQHDIVQSLHDEPQQSEQLSQLHAAALTDGVRSLDDAVAAPKLTKPARSMKNNAVLIVNSFRKNYLCYEISSNIA
ncbi:MAG TPA: hypothetical protein VEW28_03540 [Candidatus Kapabacteria bacterium]|nr:hypothetical protein [Candidatus Kapabacteria bacterium]